MKSRTSWSFLLLVVALAARLQSATAGCSATCHCDYYGFCVACKTANQVINWEGNDGSGACVANAAACPSTSAFNNGLSLTCVPEAAKVADCAAYVAYYNVDTDVYCTRCTTGKAIEYGFACIDGVCNDEAVSCVATADCESGKIYQFFDEEGQQTPTVCVNAADIVSGCAYYYFDPVNDAVTCLNCTTPGYVIDQEISWTCIHPLGCQGYDYWNNGNKTYTPYWAAPRSSAYCAPYDNIFFGCTQFNDRGYCVGCQPGSVTDEYMQSSECLACPNCVLNIYTAFEIIIYKLPFECDRFMTISQDTYMDSKFVDGVKLAVLTAYSTAAKALKKRSNALLTVFPAAVVPVFNFYPANSGESWKLTWNKGFPDYVGLYCSTVYDQTTGVDYSALSISLEIDTYITLSPTVNTNMLQQIRNDWLDAVNDVSAGQFGTQAYAMMKSVKLAIDTYVGTLGTFAKEIDRPFVGLYYYPDWVDESNADSVYPFYAYFDDTSST